MNEISRFILVYKSPIVLYFNSVLQLLMVSNNNIITLELNYPFILPKTYESIIRFD